VARAGIVRPGDDEIHVTAEELFLDLAQRMNVLAYCEVRGAHLSDDMKNLRIGVMGHKRAGGRVRNAEVYAPCPCPIGRPCARTRILDEIALMVSVNPAAG